MRGYRPFIQIRLRLTIDIESVISVGSGQTKDVEMLSFVWSSQALLSQRIESKSTPRSLHNRINASISDMTLVIKSWRMVKDATRLSSPYYRARRNGCRYRSEITDRPCRVS